mmetsp:Transcript_42565/g.120408  ORF Transcript_42565/g.120408 Transcript_42565/m.120408 type:complete len:452 (+) Transcript_42565:94-1449(+)
MGGCVAKSKRSSLRCYTGNLALRGAFSAADAQSLGFYSVDHAPPIGESVVCYRRELWMRQGVVVGVSEQVWSDGTDGLSEGQSGVLVTCKDETGEKFDSWAEYLAPTIRTEREYCSICTTAEFTSSHFCSLYACSDETSPELGPAATGAKDSLQNWLANVLDADGRRVKVPVKLRKELLEVWDQQEDPCINLYTRQQPLAEGAVFSVSNPTIKKIQRGQDYSLYYLALNNTLNHDAYKSLVHAMPLIRAMMANLRYDANGERRLHPGGTLYKGQMVPPNKKDMAKLKEALESGAVVRFRQFLSTTMSRRIATRFRKNDAALESGPTAPGDVGFEWTITIPEGYWGARDIRAASKSPQESETLFPPYASFHVESVTDGACCLRAKDLSEDTTWSEFRERVGPYVQSGRLRSTEGRNYRLQKLRAASTAVSQQIGVLRRLQRTEQRRDVHHEI